MSKGSVLKSICDSLGKNNKPTYVVMAIGVAKGIVRPMFTMMDKKEDPETKKYTAIREGLTEAIAVPTYFFCGEIAGKLSKMMPEHLQKRANKNLMFMGVCLAALIVIPGLCSLAIKPLMKKIQENNTKKKPLDITSQTENIQPFTGGHTYMPLPAHFSQFKPYGMKVGGV